MSKTKSRLLAAAKLSEYRLKRILRLYAEGISASEAAVKLRLSYPTVRGLYHLIRVRMYRIGLYRSVEDYRQFKRQWNAPEDEIDRELMEIAAALGQRRGVKDDSRAYHIAELLYRRAESRRLGVKFADLHYAKLLQLIQVSGPLNRPLTIRGRDRAREVLLNGIASELRGLSGKETEISTMTHRMKELLQALFDEH